MLSSTSCILKAAPATDGNVDENHHFRMAETHYILDTDRLHLQKFTLEDAPFIVALLNSPGWLQFIGDRNVKTEENAVAYLQTGPLKSYRDNGYGLWLVKRKEDNLSIGMCGIIRRNHLAFPDIGFAFLPPFTGNGYAYEIAAATLQYATDVLHLPVIYGITAPGNVRSIRLLKRIGLRYQKTICFTDHQDALLLYSNEAV